MAALGIILAVLVDLVLPTALVVILVRANRNGRRTDRGERIFWAWFGPIIGVYALAVIASLSQIWVYSGAGVVVASIFALPASGIPASFNSTVIHYFFTTEEWAHVGYFVVTCVYSVGLIAWAALPTLAIRRLTQRLGTPRKR
jgi:hypothetical protein